MRIREESLPRFAASSCRRHGAQSGEVDTGSPAECATKSNEVFRSRIAAISGCTAFILAIEA